MERDQILVNDSEFAGFRIAGRLSRRHKGEREVYRAVDAEGRHVALTVYDIRCSRYAADKGARPRQPDFIDEVRFFQRHAADARDDSPALPGFVGCGIDSFRRRRYGWLALEYIEGVSLDEEISRRGAIAVGDAFEIMRRVVLIATDAARFTLGGGHYNISTDNILVRYDGDRLADVRLVGFSNIGPSYTGGAPIDEESLDKRFRAPETLKRIHDHRSDQYSLGMVMLLMLTGHHRVIQTGHYSIDTGGATTDMTGLTPKDFHKTLWELADKCLPKPLKVVLRKATAISPSERFATPGKLSEFLERAERLLSADTPSAREATPDSKKPETDKPELAYSRAGSRKADRLTDFGKSLRQSGDAGPRKALDEVAGMSDLKALFRRDFIRIVRNPDVARAYGIKPGNCTLLYGPQGCGKTFIAEKAAQESGLKYKIVNPSELGSIYVHGSQQKIAELFDEAEKNGPMILIFDEFDALVPKRESDVSGNQANEVNEMLTRLNNCASRGVYVLATTNRPGLIDPAVMRKGRVDRTVYVPLPDREARAELFRLELDRRPHDYIDYDALASATDNYTGSDISFIVEETARLCFEETLDRGFAEPVALTTKRLMEVAGKTQPSVSEAQRKEYLDLKARMEDREARGGRKKVGFLS